MAGQFKLRPNPKNCQLSLPNNRPSRHPTTSNKQCRRIKLKINSNAFSNIKLNAGNQISMNLRFLGLDYDQENNLSYNYFRDNDEKMGKAIQKDRSH